jgi:hypothetical protein
MKLFIKKIKCLFGFHEFTDANSFCESIDDYNDIKIKTIMRKQHCKNCFFLNIEQTSFNFTMEIKGEK